MVQLIAEFAGPASGVGVDRVSHEGRFAVGSALSEVVDFYTTRKGSAGGGDAQGDTFAAAEGGAGTPGGSKADNGLPAADEEERFDPSLEVRHRHSERFQPRVCHFQLQPRGRVLLCESMGDWFLSGILKQLSGSV